MAKVLFEDALENATLEIADKFLVVETAHDGFTNTHLGQYSFRVVKETSGTVGGADYTEDYKVFPIYMREDGVYVNEKYPVIMTDGDLVLFSKNTLIDPYGATHIEEFKVKEGQNKEHIVLHAFNSYVLDAFRLSVYHVMIEDGNSVEDNAIEYEQITAFERDVIHPWAGTYRAGEEYQ